MNSLKCRFCLELHYPEAGSFSLLNVPFSTAIKRVFSFEIKSEQHLSEHVCKICSAMVWQFYTYSIMVEDNQHKLEQEFTLLNAETPRNLVEDYRIENQAHVAIKSESLDSSTIHTDLPSSSSNVVNSAPINESASSVNIKVEPQDEESKPDEMVVNSEKTAEDKIQPVLGKALADNVKLEEYVITTYVEGSNASIAETVALEQQTDDDSTSNVIANDQPHHESDETDLSSASSSQSNAHDQPLTQPPNTALILCDQCERPFFNRRQLRNHQRVHKFSECPICKKMIKGDFITQHLAAHEGAFRCDICDASFGCTANLRMHKDMKHAADAQPGDETFPCEVCERTFRNKTQLSLHRKQHKTKQCPICMKHVRSMHFQTHISIHQGAFYCDLCERAFSSRKNLTKHKNVKHSSLVPVTISCDQCELTFPNQTKLSAHRKGHQRKQCPICKKAFRPNKIKEHLASHDGAFRCGSCGKTFSTKYSLKKHNRTSNHCGTGKSGNASENELAASVQ
ncbi:zinc finger protein 184-like [Anopheles funestus]|uniref:zinc finger protein 184-like n=1 Tax=Anopheles funestus TaxID=62324 RepID=UPI0020C6A870|nr:zinc finger protein 184-like [Anopheles funestus]